ncbi:MAG: hypothetical protein HC828_04195 [Blastochloris sp.]|nr:hypothetical protein [Blastochloris sp.]
MVVGLTQGINSSLFFALIGAVVGILFGGLTSGSVPEKVIPNQGIRNSLRIALLSWLLVLPVSIGIRHLTSSGVEHWVAQMSGWANITLLFGTIASLLYGGYAVLSHLVLRLLLTYAGAMPWNYACFLNYAHERIFLRRVGGGYIFYHRLLQEHLAAATETTKPPEVEKDGETTTH